MRFLHISDLHIGKRIYNVDLLEDQKYILKQVLEMAHSRNCDGVLIAGDIYDKTQPSAQAIEVVDTFFTQLSMQGMPVYMISGNHDNSAQISYCSSILRKGGIYATERFCGTLQKITLYDIYGSLNLYLLPFVRPAHVRRFFPNEKINSYEEAIRVILQNTQIDEKDRNVLVAHQYVCGARTCESEERSIGGLDQIPAELFEKFCYTALGHLHSPQTLLNGKMRYSGSILKYSFDEATQIKSALFVEIDGQGIAQVEKLPFVPLRDMRVLNGTMEELLQSPYSEDYLQITLNDKTMLLDAMGALRINFPNLLHLKMQNLTVGQEQEIESVQTEEKSPIEHFYDFYRLQNNGILPDEQRMLLIRQALREVEEEKD